MSEKTNDNKTPSTNKLARGQRLRAAAYTACALAVPAAVIVGLMRPKLPAGAGE